MAAYRPTIALDLILNALIAAEGVLDGAKVALFTNSIVPTPETVAADLIAPTFPGYALSSAIVWGDPLSVPGGRGSLGDRKDFIPSADSESLPVVGYAVLTGFGWSTIGLVELFPTPVDVSLLGSIVSVSPLYAVKHAAT